MALLASGGVALILGGPTTQLPSEVEHDPRFIFWDTVNDEEDALSKPFPDNTRAILMTRFLKRPVFTRAHRFATRRHVTLFPAITDGDTLRRTCLSLIDDPRPNADPTTERGHQHAPPSSEGPKDRAAAELDALFPAPEVPVPTPSDRLTDTDVLIDAVTRAQAAQRAVDQILDTHASDTESRPMPTHHAPQGSIKAFVAAAAPKDGPIVDNARELLRLAKQQGIATTEGSLSVTISAWRKAHGIKTVLVSRKGIPRSRRAEPRAAALTVSRARLPEPRTTDDPVLQLLDDLAASVALVREAVVKVLEREQERASALDVLRGALQKL